MLINGSEMGYLNRQVPISGRGCAGLIKLNLKHRWDVALAAPRYDSYRILSRV